MILADLVAGDAVFVDANILTYDHQPHPVFGPPCTQFLQRIENQELVGYTSTHVVSEVTHRLMTIEASVRFGWSFAGIGNRLRHQPSAVQQLSAFRLALDKVVQGDLQILTISAPLLVTAPALSQQIGLLTNDALIAELMQANGLTHLASSDADLDRVPGITRYGPA
jgi:predicted nucleic acid-binding protein